MDLDLVIVNWNSGEHLGHLLDSVKRVRDVSVQVRVVDNASEDYSLTPAHASAGVLVDELPTNLGFGAAANRGIAASQADYVLLLNPDVRLQSDSIWNLYHEIRNRPQVGLACGPLFDDEGRSQKCFQLRPFPSLGRVVSDVLFFDELLSLVKARLRNGSGLESEQVPTGATVISEQPAAAYWLLRKSAWEAVGGFDERFFPAWFEDVDFCKRLLENRWQILFVPKAWATHRGGLSVQRLGYRRFIDIYYRNLLKYWRKHHPSSLVVVVPVVRLGLLLRKSIGRK